MVESFHLFHSLVQLLQALLLYLLPVVLQQMQF
jgi:hypothetical protein